MNATGDEPAIDSEFVAAPIRHDRLEDVRLTVASWIVEAGLADVGPQALVKGAAQKMREVGLPLDRLQVSFRLLHPLFDGMSLTFTEATGLETAYNTGRRQPTEAFRRSPYYHMLTNGLRELRTTLDSNEPLPFPVWDELRERGYRDYLALAVGFNGAPIAYESDGVLASFTTRKDRFGDDEEYSFRWLMHPLALALRSAINAQIARTALETYHGSLVGERILGGTILRGSGERLTTAIWYCDMRNSTGLADGLPLEQFLGVLDAYFECTAGAVKEGGGQVLDILGDAVLGIFPVLGDTSPGAACRQALAAALDAGKRLDDLVAKGRRDADRIAFGIGIHFGDVVFGNVGTPDRLKFTLEAARTAELTKRLGHPVLLTDAVSRRLGPAALDDLGEFELRGLPHARRLYVPHAG